jgi:FtsZ-binding cell division protein ZapB
MFFDNHHLTLRIAIVEQELREKQRMLDDAKNELKTKDEALQVANETLEFERKICEELRRALCVVYRLAHNSSIITLTTNIFCISCFTERIASLQTEVEHLQETNKMLTTRAGQQDDKIAAQNDKIVAQGKEIAAQGKEIAELKVVSKFFADSRARLLANQAAHCLRSKIIERARAKMSHDEQEVFIASGSARWKYCYMIPLTKLLDWSTVY